MIIIEGTDCVGKTSLINQLKEYFNEYYLKHFTNPPNNMTMQEQHEYNKKKYYDEIDNPFKKMIKIYDRFHLGEMVYAPMYRGYEPDYIEDLEEKLNYKGAMLVLLVANVDDIKKRFDGNFIREEHIGEVQQRFIQAYKDSKIQNKMILNTSHIDQYKAAKEVFKKWSTP
jgi:thymidylate kinase